MNERIIKVALDQAMADDPTNTFWQSLTNSPNYPAFEADIDYIINQSRKHGKPFNDIDPGERDSYDWKLK